MRWVVFLTTTAVLMMGGGCTTVQRGSQRARVAVVSTGDRIESGVTTVAVKTRSWWSRMFNRNGATAERSRRKAATHGRYEIVEPQYVGSRDSVPVR